MTPKQLYEANLTGVSYTILGRKLGVTRSAISGRVNKYRISIGGVTATEYAAGKRNKADICFMPKVKKPRRKTRAVEIDKTTSYPHAPAPKINIENLGDWLDSVTCRYLGSDYKVEAYQFCGHERMKGSSYCADHHELTHKKERVKYKACTDGRVLRIHA